MRYKVRLAWAIVLLLVIQLALRSAAPVLAVRSVPAVAASPALGLSDLAVMAPDGASPFLALPLSVTDGISETTHQAAPVPIDGSLPPVQRGDDAVPVTLQVSSASGEPGIHQYFVPFDDRNLWALFEGKASCHGGQFQACLPLVSRIFVTAGADGTRWYYDHWEDGYDAEPLDPGPGSTTETGTLDAGDTAHFESAILVTQIGQGPPYYYDGRDRITIKGEDANVVRWANAGSFQRPGGAACNPGGGGGYPNSSGWLAAAWEVLEVGDWGDAYHATVGEDLDYSGGVPDDHDYAGLEIMAAQNGTKAYYRGAQVAILDAGETLFVAGANDGPGGGGVDSADDISATMPIQVQMMTGACSENIVSAHGYTLQPRDAWDTVYWAPVPGFLETGDPAGRPNVDTDIYLHNPDRAQAISVAVTSGLSVTNLSIPAAGTVSVLRESGWTDLAGMAQGTHMSSAGVFWGVAVIDSATNGTGDSQDWDWGYSLIPESELSSQIVVGYAPGKPDLGDNGSLAFVVAVTDTVLYADLDQDGQPDRFDMDGDGALATNDAWGVPEWDESVSNQGVPVRAGQVLRVGDANDRNLEGARIYTIELGEHIAAAWGQDPTRADTLGYLDLGYTLLPLQVPHLDKKDGLAVDADGSGGLSPGDTLTYTLYLTNNGMGTMNNVVLTDSLPYTYTDFVVGSLQITTPPPTATVEYYDGGSWGTAPISNAQELRITWPYLGPTQMVTITFLALLRTVPPEGLCNQGVATSANTDPVTATVCTQFTDLELVKDDDPAFVAPGGVLTYTLVYTNRADLDARDVYITDTLPEEATYGGMVEQPAGWSDPPTHTLGPPETLTWYTPTLAAGASGRMVYTVTVDAGFVGTVTNSVCISTTTPDGRYDNNCDHEVTVVGCDVAITKADDPDPVTPGARLVYTLVYTHTGSMPAENTIVTDTLPPEVAFVEAYPVQTSGLNPLLWNLGTLGAGEGGMILVTVTVGSWVTSTLTNTVSIATDTPEARYDNNKDEEPTDVLLADVTITKSDDPDPVGPRSPGRQLIYTLVYTNNGPAPAENVVVSDTLPPEVAFDAASPAQSSGPNPLLWNLGTLAVGEGGAIVVTATVHSWVGETFTNTACVATVTPEVRNSSCAQEPTQIRTDVAIGKSDYRDPGVPGGPLTYTLVYTNNGPFDAQRVYITDTFPISVTYGGIIEQPAGWNGPEYAAVPTVTLTWYTPTLAAGVLGRIVYTVTVDPQVPGNITNTVRIDTTTPEYNIDNNWDVEPTAVRLLYFRARPQPGAILLEWETAWEVNTYGFSVLRSVTTRLEEAKEIVFVPAAGLGGGGASYSYRDRRLEIGPTYSYWLAELDTSGRRTVYYPVSAAALPGGLYRAYLPLVWRQ